jgi:hypothetical protein
MIKIYVLIIASAVALITAMALPIYAPGKISYFGKGEKIQCNNIFKWMPLLKCANDKWAQIGVLIVVCEDTILRTEKICDDYCVNKTQCKYDETTIAYKVKSEIILDHQWKIIKYNDKIFIILCSLLGVNIMIIIAVGVIQYIEYSRKKNIYSDLNESLQNDGLLVTDDLYE